MSSRLPKVQNGDTQVGLRLGLKNQVPHQGMADFYAKSNRVRTAIRVVVSANIGDNMLIAYQDLLKFQVIHIDFPYKVLTYTVKADVLAKIKHDFRDVLNNSLNPIPMKTPSPMTINLKETAKPLKVLAARRVPKRFEELRTSSAKACHGLYTSQSICKKACTPISINQRYPASNSSRCNIFPEDGRRSQLLLICTVRRKF